MRLQLRLTLAGLALIVLFVFSYALTWAVRGRERPRGMSGRIAREASRVYRESGWDGVQMATRYSFFPTSATTVYDMSQKERFHQGPPLPLEPEAFARTCQQGSWETWHPWGLELWARLDGAEGPQGVIRLVLVPHDHDEQRGHDAATSALALVVATSVCILACLWGSSRIARPIQVLVRGTQALARSDFHTRITPSGWGELRELAVSFNGMAENLERTIFSLTQAKERAERSEASRRQFLADASHNLRTPLAAILGWTEALIDGLGSGEEQVHLANIRNEAVYVSRNVQRLTDLSRWEGRPPQLLLETFPVSEPLMDCLQTLEEEAQRKGVQLQLLGLEGEPRVRGDRGRLRELFQLLLENAIHHNSPGTRLELRFVPRDQRLEVQVYDDGPELPEQYRQDLECRASGGLGLAIAARLARAHGDELRLAQEGPTGKCFTFSLSLEPEV